MAISLQNVPELQGFLVPNVRPTGRPLGHGAYGSVEEVEIPGALCAAKKIHDILLRMGSPGEVRNLTAKFVEECQLMSSLRHPHIVQFLGICFLPGSRVPALVMEKLLTSVDELLERNPNIPLSIKRNILHDVARGLAFLHSQSPPIIHRDLTAKNVLLNSSMVAKIADLGVARIVDIQPGRLAATMSQAPGTIVYMPPEALEPRARYDTKIDIFSLGNLAMYILTQIFPELLAPTYADPQTRRVVARTEIERRIEYIHQIHQQLGREHPLVQMVEWCLENFPEDRPTILQVLRQLEQARALIPDRYGEMNKLEMVQALRERERENQQQREQLETQDQQLQLLQEPQHQLQFKDQQIRDLQAEVQEKEAESRQTVQENQQQREQLQSNIRNLQAEVQTKSQQLQTQQQQLQSKDGQIRNFQIEVQTRSQQLQTQQQQLQFKDGQIRNLQAEVESSSTRQDPQQTELVTDLLSLVQRLQLEKEELQTRLQEQNLPGQQLLSLKWRRGRDMPIAMKSAKSVILDGSVYIGGGLANGESDNHIVQVYNPERDEWTQLPTCPVKFFATTTMNHQLVLAGGLEQSAGRDTNQITVWNSRSQQWTAHPYPAMPTARATASAIGYKQFLIVAGGFRGSSLDVVEVLNTSTSQWRTVEPLPIPCDWMSSALLGDTLYLLGGLSGLSSIKAVLAAHFPALIFPQRAQTTTPTWEKLPDVPLERSTAVVLHNSLLAVGGWGQGWGPTSDIHLYTPSTKQWTKIGDLPTGLGECTCTELPSGELLVLGGEGIRGLSSEVYIATVND